jgi:hypothetical protein
MRQHGATHSSSSSSSSSHGRARKPQHDVPVTRPDYKQQGVSGDSVCFCSWQQPWLWLLLSRTSTIAAATTTTAAAAAAASSVGSLLCTWCRRRPCCWNHNPSQ